MLKKVLNFSSIIATIVFLNNIQSVAFGLPQFQRLLKQEYGFKAPCATCHSQGGGSSLSAYGKAFEKAGKNANAIRTVASFIPKGDKLDFGTKLKAKANPNDPESTPQAPGTWAGQSDIPTKELKEFSPSEIDKFTVLEGELNDSQVDGLKTKLGSIFQDEDKFPTFYFGETAGKKKFVVQYVRIEGLKRTLGLVVSTKADVVGLSFIGTKGKPLSDALKASIIGKSLAGIESLLAASKDEEKEIVGAVVRGLSVIKLAFGAK